MDALQDSQDEASNSASRRSTSKPAASDKHNNEDGKYNDNNKDVVKPLVDWQGGWSKALRKHGLTSSKADVLEEQPEELSQEEIHLEHQCLARKPSRSLSPTSSKPSLAFSDKKYSSKDKDKKITLAQASANNNSEDFMFRRCSKTRVYATEKGSGGSWMVVEEDDAKEEWEALDGAVVNDGWDFVPQTERLKDKTAEEGGKKRFNDRAREFFDAEKKKREARGRDLDNQALRGMAGLNRRAAKAKVAVLYQAIEPPIINGVRKPMKPGGYQDSGADVAFALQDQPDIILLTPRTNPDPTNQAHWTFPDTETGILSALSRGATHLWANTNLFASHPLQSSRVAEFEDDVKVIGQPPLMVELFDDKEEFPRVMLEQFLAGEEATITVFPPSVEEGRRDYWAGPVVTRFNHQDGVAPFNSLVAVKSNSRVLTLEEFEKDVHYRSAARQCEEVAKLLKVTAAIRIDVRRFEKDGKFVLFDVNMKPADREEMIKPV
ncbi:hypothetical protein D0Z07_0270 [Hyphodiscus hymeniophilus]|uniref:Uncharacterized protein n=1 Tax=Hyphodiscus hymeniophilus TaxID=353542 RepID=A0A9P6VSU8_9HELO|nr:hypothetical protein D0Z07_0270 [Hyphodiscus hymeniophilus]